MKPFLFLAAILAAAGCSANDRSNAGSTENIFTLRVGSRPDNPLIEGRGMALVLELANQSDHAIAIRGVRYESGAESDRPWLERRPGPVKELPDGGLEYQLGAAPSGGMQFERGLMFPGETLTVSAPLPPQGASAEKRFVIRYVDLGPRDQWMKQVLLPEPIPPKAPIPAIERYKPVTDQRLSLRKGAGSYSLVRTTCRPESIPLPEHQITLVARPH